jgi:hypothetical protein
MKASYETPPRIIVKYFIMKSNIYWITGCLAY